MAPWSEIAPGHWQRPIGENEALIKMIGDGGQQFGRDIWSISVTAFFVAHIGGSKSLTELFCDGWKALRFRHPSIACCSYEKGLEYLVPDPHQLQQWADESFMVVSGDTDLDDIIGNHARRRFATLYYLQDKDAVLLHVAHWRTDGIGAFHLLNEYFKAVVDSLHENPNELAWGGETARLVPSVEDALNLPFETTPDIEQAAKQFQESVKHFAGAVGTPYKLGLEALPQGTRSARTRCSHGDTAQMKSQCRRLDISLGAAVHATVAATAYSIAGKGSCQRHYSSTIRHSIRPYLLAPYDGPAGAAGLYTAGYIVKIPPHQTWLENAKYYEAEYTKGATAALLSSRRHYAVIMKAAMERLPTPNPPPSGLDFSWIPDADTLVQTTHKHKADVLEIKNIGIGIDVLSRHLYVFMWTFNGQLELNLVFNEAFYDAGMAREIVNHIKKHLISNLLCTSSLARET